MSKMTVEDKLDKIMEDIVEIKIDMARNTDSLELHIKRSDMLESKLDQDYGKLEDKIKPMISFYERSKGALWILVALGSILLGLKELGVLSKLF